MFAAEILTDMSISVQGLLRAVFKWDYLRIMARTQYFVVMSWSGLATLIVPELLLCVQ